MNESELRALFASVSGDKHNDLGMDMLRGKNRAINFDKSLRDRLSEEYFKLAFPIEPSDLSKDSSNILSVAMDLEKMLIEMGFLARLITNSIKSKMVDESENLDSLNRQVKNLNERIRLSAMCAEGQVAHTGTFCESLRILKFVDTTDPNPNLKSGLD